MNSRTLSPAVDVVSEDSRILFRQGHHWQLLCFAFLLCVLLAIPRARIVIGGPVYLLDVLGAILLMFPMKGVFHHWVPKSSLSDVVSIYLGLVVLSELVGLILYGTIFESVYMMARFTLAICLFFCLPRLITRPRDMQPLFQGLVIGVLFAAIITILYSLGPTRDIVLHTVYSIDVINPGWDRFVQHSLLYGAGEAAMRGTSLVGAATFTAGFLGLSWPLTFVAFQLLKAKPLWRLLSLSAAVVSPIAILMTYGRTAWLMVIVVGLLIVLFNMANMRRMVIVVASLLAMSMVVFKVDTELFYFDRITEAAQVAVDQPSQDESVSERVLSYTQPFAHLMNNPSWLFFGVGRAGSKATERGVIEGQLYDEGELATHSGFAMSFYSFGMPAAVCQIAMLILSFTMIRRRIRISLKVGNDRILWQSMLMSWCCMVIWWLSGHGMVGEPRGVMLLFFFYGLIMAFEKLATLAYIEKVASLRPAQ